MSDTLLFPWSPARCKTTLSSNAFETVRLQPLHHVKSLKYSSHWMLVTCTLWTVSDGHWRGTPLLEFERCDHELALRKNGLFLGSTRALSSNEILKNKIQKKKNKNNSFTGREKCFCVLLRQTSFLSALLLWRVLNCIMWERQKAAQVMSKIQPFIDSLSIYSKHLCSLGEFHSWLEIIFLVNPWLKSFIRMRWNISAFYLS